MLNVTHYDWTANNIRYGLDALPSCGGQAVRHLDLIQRPRPRALQAPPRTQAVKGCLADGSTVWCHPLRRGLGIAPTTQHPPPQGRRLPPHRTAGLLRRCVQRRPAGRSVVRAPGHDARSLRHRLDRAPAGNALRALRKTEPEERRRGPAAALGGLQLRAARLLRGPAFPYPPRRTGIALYWFRNRARTRLGSPSSWRSGRRRSVSSIQTFSSSRASAAPRQKCRPRAPKAWWSLTLWRWMSKRWGSVEHLGVAVGRQVPQQQPVALLDLLALQLDVAGGGAGHERERRVAAQALLHGGGNQGRVVLQLGDERGVLEQRLHDPAVGGPGRVVARRHQQDEEHGDLELVEPLAVDLGVHQRA